MVFAQRNYNIGINIAFSGAVELYQGNFAPDEQAKQWLKSKRGIPCRKAGAFIAEYNLRFRNNDDGSFGDCFLRALASQYQNHL